MKGILFKPDMIKAIVEGRKTQTRRLGGLKEINQEPDRWTCNGWAGSWQGFAFSDKSSATTSRIAKPRYQVGEVVYIKEAWGLAINEHGHNCLCYKSTNDDDMALDNPQMMRLWDSNKKQWILEQTESPRWYPDRWRSPLFMPEWAARRFIKFTGVGAGRVQEISPKDCVAEGVIAEYGDGLARRDKFETLWDSINPKYSWESNPWVFPYSFKRVEAEK